MECTSCGGRKIKICSRRGKGGWNRSQRESRPGSLMGFFYWTYVTWKGEKKELSDLGTVRENEMLLATSITVTNFYKNKASKMCVHISSLVPPSSHFQWPICAFYLNYTLPGSHPGPETPPLTQVVIHVLLSDQTCILVHLLYSLTSNISPSSAHWSVNPHFPPYPVALPCFSVIYAEIQWFTSTSLYLYQLLCLFLPLKLLIVLECWVCSLAPWNWLKSPMGTSR